MRLLAWLGAAGAARRRSLTWANLRGVPRGAEPKRPPNACEQGAIATTVCAAVLVTVARCAIRSAGGAAAPPAVLLVASMVLVGGGAALAARARRAAGAVRRRRRSRRGIDVAPPPRVRAALLDGASLGFIRQRVAAGQLPNFGRLLDRGATIDLATLKPTQAEPVWAAAATGQVPAEDTACDRTRCTGCSADEPSPVDLLPDYCFALCAHRSGLRHARDS